MQRRAHDGQLQRTVQLQQTQQAAAAASSPAQPASSSPRPSAGMSSAPFESHLDRSNPLILRVLEMARVLHIDANTEFYLLPIALHALAAPPVDSDPPATDASQPGDGATHAWFLALVNKERARFQKSPTENSPWVKIQPVIAPPPLLRITDDPTAPLPALTTAAPPSAPAPFWYNFRTFRRASTLPPTASAGSRSREDEQLLLHGSPHLSSRLSASVRLPPLRRGFDNSSDLEVMRFTSWFTERSLAGLDASGCSEHRGSSASASSARGSKRYIQIRYWLAREEFEVEILPSTSASATGNDPAAQPQQAARVYKLKSVHTTKHGGGVASCWDLHLKATLDLFGRPTTLLQCDSATRQWLETNARRLMAVRTLLESKLSKFEKTHTNTHSAAQNNVPLAEVHLRSVMKDVARLKAKLAAYRPALAEKYKL